MIIMINRNIFTGELDLDKQERFTFGKYKGKLINNIKIIDNDYLKWLGNNDMRFKLSDTWRYYCEQQYNPDIVYTTYMK